MTGRDRTLDERPRLHYRLKCLEAPFRWNADNIDHIGRHGVSPAEVEYVLHRARPPFPRAIGDGKHLVWGRAEDGTYLQVIFVYSPAGVVYVIHARVLTDREKKQFRR